MAIVKHTRCFIEGCGGVVFDRNGREALSVNVQTLQTQDAHRIMKTVLDALNDEFADK